ncbi:MAG TPA: 4a-hydroxytetrahydrobiopterin dehydratase [Micromonosporaceae bacterium]
MAELLTADEIAAGLAGLPEWSGDASAIRRTVALPSFGSAIRAVDDVAAVAEEMDHHPDIDIRWRTLTFACATHAMGGVTDLDLALARRIDEVVARAAAD